MLDPTEQTGYGSFDYDDSSPSRFTDNMKYTKNMGYRAVLRYLFAISENSPEVNASVEHMTNHIVRSGFTCNDGVRQCGEQMRSFFRQIVRNIFVAGYAVYRIEKGRKRKSADSATAEPLFMVAAGEKTMITFDTTENRWIPEYNSSSPQVYTDWKVVVMCRPTKKRPDSYVFAARKDIERIETLTECYVKRETANSEHRILTQIEDKQTITEAGRPWFSMAVANSGTTAGGTTEDLRQARLNFIREVSSITSELRRDRETDRVGAGFHANQPGSFHKESMLTDGFKATQALNTLHGSPDFRSVLTLLRNNVLRSLGVPPQSLGENIQTERVGGSQVIVNQSLLLFRDRVERMKSLFVPIIEPLGLNFRVNISSYILPDVLPLVMPEKGVELVSLAYSIPEDYIDLEKIKIKQSMLLEGSKQTALPGEQKKVDSREKKTPQEVISTEFMKGEQRV